MSPMHWLELAAWISVPITAAIAAWWGSAKGLVRLEARMDGIDKRFEIVESDVRYAHQRIDGLRAISPRTRS